jgi:hypothetical protein
MPSAKPEIAIRISDGNVESAVQSVRFASPDGEARFVELARQAEKLNVRLTPPDQDVEGHEASPTTVLANIGLDEDDTVGHAISIHFPDAEAARRFRNQLLAAGAVTATLALGAGAGMALAPGVQVESGSASQAGSIDTSAQIREGGALSSAAGAAGSIDTSAQLREGPAFAGSQAGSQGTAAQLREGGALSSAAGSASSIDTSAQIREGGALSSASGAGSIDTSAQIREGGALSSASQGSATDTAAQIREGGSADEEEESITRGGLNPNP